MRGTFTAAMTPASPVNVVDRIFNGAGMRFSILGGSRPSRRRPERGPAPHCGAADGRSNRPASQGQVLPNFALAEVMQLDLASPAIASHFSAATL